MVKKSDVFVAISIAVFVLSLAYVTSLGGLGPLPPVDARKIAYAYLNLTYNPWQPFLTAFALESVTAIIWDFRGLDTLYETAVFYGAIIASIALYRGVKISLSKKEWSKLGLSPIAKTVTRLSFVLIPTVAASVALHGHLTPGGGFQGGSALAVAPLLLIFAMSRYFVEKLGIKESTALSLRTIGLIMIGIVGLVPLILGLGSAYFMQNQPKPGSVFTGFPNYVANVLLGGSLLYYNIAEFLAVGAGFTVIFLLLSIPEDIFKKIIRREGEVAY